jgi:N-acetylglucosaminyl-diphospho-decaprenol L-rhamnosyltransferase
MSVDCVTVAYRSGAYLRACVEPLCEDPDLQVIVVDNACPENSTATLAGLPVQIVKMGRNAGFAAGCNAGARTGSGDAILFVNPDARILPVSVHRLAERLQGDCGAVGPRIRDADGRTQRSIRRSPRLGSAFAEALYLHHLFPRAVWSTEVVQSGYDDSGSVEWLSGAVLAVQRSAFEAVGGFDERFFLYSEDADLCLRLRERGFRVCYEAAAEAWHEGSGSAPRAGQLPVLAEARIVYARLHERGLRYAAFRFAFALGELTRLPLAALRSQRDLRGRARALAVTIGAADARPSAS